jgi:hypothetical protein
MAVGIGRCSRIGIFKQRMSGFKGPEWVTSYPGDHACRAGLNVYSEKRPLHSFLKGNYFSFLLNTGL